MAHYAEIDEQGIVIRVLKIPDEEESRGQDYLANELGLGGTWIQTSYTSQAGKRVDPDTREIIDDSHYRYNYAGIGFIWDPNMGEDGAFIPPKPENMNSWVVDTVTANWIPPIDYPQEEGNWDWDEDSISWKLVEDIIN